VSPDLTDPNNPDGLPVWGVPVVTSHDRDGDGDQDAVVALAERPYICGTQIESPNLYLLDNVDGGLSVTEAWSLGGFRSTLDGLTPTAVIVDDLDADGGPDLLVSYVTWIESGNILGLFEY
jgi:hypothetical protein